MDRIYSVFVLSVSLLVCSVAFAGDALPPIRQAGSDAQGRITVNGKPFFPILMYDVPTDAESLKMFREHGFNTLSAGIEDADKLLANGFYIAAHVGKKSDAKLEGVLFGVGMDSPALYWKTNLLEQSKADLARMRELVPNRPIMNAIGYWENEPDGVYSNSLPARERYEELVKVLDVSAPYLYPLPYQPVRSVGEAVGRANAATGGKKPLLPILQLFTWKPGDRYPTPAELKCMVYLALIHGADGIGYYSYNYVTGKKDTNIAKEQPELWAAVKKINGEVKQIGEFLSDSQPEASVKLKDGGPGVELRADVKSGSTLILIANTENQPKTVTLQLPARGKSLKRLDGSKDVSVEKGIAKIPFAPNEAVALTF